MTDCVVVARGSFLERITADERDKLLVPGITRRLPPGRRMLVEGRHDTHVEIIRQGHVKVTTDVGGTPRLLATLVGAAEDTVQKSLRTLRGRGLIRTGYRRITVIDPAGLTTLADLAEDT